MDITYKVCDRCARPISGPAIDRLLGGALAIMGSEARRKLNDERVVLERNRERAYSRQTFDLCPECNCLFDDWLLRRGTYENEG